MNRNDRRRAEALGNTPFSGLVGADGNPLGKPGLPPRPPRVLMVFPSGRTWEADMAMSAMAIAQFSAAHGVHVLAFNYKSSAISVSRNMIVENALGLKQGKPDYIFWQDTDMTNRPDALVRLLNHQKDIVGAVYNKRRPPYETLGHLIGEQRDTSKGGLFPADYLPGGFVLVKLSVYESIPWPWYFETYHRDRYKGRGEPKAPDQIAAFVQMMDDAYNSKLPFELFQMFASNPTFKRWLEASVDAYRFPQPFTGEDYGFCQKAIRYGYKLWCDLDVTDTIGHLGDQVVTCKVKGPQPGDQPGGSQDTDHLALRPAEDPVPDA